MARSKEEDATWESHRHELRTMFLEQRLTVEQIRQHMSQKYNFSKSKDQYIRQFKKWDFKKNLTDDDWRFIAHRREKRKRDGKDPGSVRLNGNLVPEAKVRKELGRHPLSISQYPGIVGGGSEPRTPEGIVVGTPRSEIHGTDSHDSTTPLQMDWLLGPPEAFEIPDIEVPNLIPIVDGIHDQLPIEIPELLSPSAYHIPVIDTSAESCTNQVGATGKPDTQLTPVTNAMPTHQNGPIHCGFEPINKEIVEGTGSLFKYSIFSPSTRSLSDLSELLEPITIGNVHSDLIRKAEAIFQTNSSDNLSNYLSLCVYLSSNNLLSSIAMDKLLLAIVKTDSQLRLKTLLQSQTTTMEIFMSNLLASATARGEVEITRMLVNHGADVDALSGDFSRATPLLGAIKSGNVECVRLLLEAGSDPNLAVTNRTPLQTACSAPSCSIGIVELLLKSGAHVSPPQDSARLTALQLAVALCLTDVVCLLLQWKADPNSFTTSKNGTALQIACSSSSNAEIPELLISAGADIDTRSGYKYNDESFSHEHSEDSDAASDSDDVFKDSDVIDESILFKFKPAILIAADNENWETVQLLLEEGAAVNPSMRTFPIKSLETEFVFDHPTSPVVLTPLQAAVRAQNITMARMLLSAGAHVDARPKSKHGHTALQIAAMVGNQRLVQILLLKGADINAAAGVYNGRTALQAAAHHSDTGLLSLLLKEGADVNAPPSPKYGKTALQVAIAASNIDAVKILLEAGASVNTDQSCNEGLAALQESIKIEDFEVRDEIVSLLLHAGACFEPPAGREEYGALHTAVNMEDLEMTKKLLKSGASPNIGFCRITKFTPLQKASSLGNETLVHLLISHGADINAPAHNSGGRTALQSAIESGDLTVVKVLLKSGADISARRAYQHGVSAIDAAARTCKEELVQIILDEDPEIISSDPITRRDILRDALTNWRCSVSFVRLLLKNGADVNNPPTLSSLKPCLQIAAEKGDFEIVQCLLTAGADVNRRWKPEKYSARVTALQAAVFTRNIDIVRMLIEWGADVNAPAHPNAGGQTALQIAVSTNYFEMVQFLVQNGADINGVPSQQRGRTALQQAASSGYMKLTQYLLHRNADVNAPPADFGGITALQGASINGNIRIVMMLLAAGADISAAPAIENGRSAIEGAAENGRLDTLHLLLNYHPDTEEFEIKRKRAAKLALANGHLAIGRFLMAYRKSAWK